VACLPSLKRTVNLKTSSRYQGQAAVFGLESQKKLGSLKLLVVGAGALGCEILKNLALMGVSTLADGGVAYVTDPDSIEMSNLNRQFLFRSHSVGKNKAITAADAARKMNPDFHVEAYQERVSAENNSTVFTDSFWDSLDLVINALDNVPSRMFVDSQCVYYGKALLESGTLGTKANTLPVIPQLTESYGSDPVKDFDSTAEIPACTLHAYPTVFEHALTWARDAVFEKDFVIDPNEAKDYLESFRSKQASEYMQKLKRQPNSMAQRVRSVRGVLCGVLPSDHAEGLFPYTVPTHAMNPTCSSSRARSFTYRDCVWLARLKFEELFSNKISLLLTQHPANSKDGDVPFWSGKRRLPSAAYFDEDDFNHLLFVSSAAKLFAQVHGVAIPEDDLQATKTICKELTSVPEFTVSATPSQTANEDESWKQDFQAAESVVNGLGDVYIEPQKFDKDDDLHIDLVWSAAVIRAKNYKIPVVDRMEAKRVVGRIIPAIATTTAAATGLVMLELYKCVLSERRVLEHFRASNFNLAVNAYASFEPKPCHKIQRFRDMDCNLWTVITLKGDLTVEDVLKRIHDILDDGFEVSSLSTTGEVCLYNDLFSADNAKVLKTRVSDLYRKALGKEPPSVFIPLTVDGDFDEEGDEDELTTVSVPPIRLRWKEL